MWLYRIQLKLGLHGWQVHVLSECFAQTSLQLDSATVNSVGPITTTNVSVVIPHSCVTAVVMVHIVG